MSRIYPSFVANEPDTYQPGRSGVGVGGTAYAELNRFGETIPKD